MADSKRNELILRAMIHVVAADGEVGEGEITRLRWIYGRVCGQDIHDEQVRAMVARVAGYERDFDAFLRCCAAELEPWEHRLLLQAAYAVAMADGSVRESEDAMLVRFAQSFDVPPAIYRSLMSPFKITRELIERPLCLVR